MPLNKSQHRIVIAIIGRDMPGVVSALSAALGECGCTLEEVSQTALHGQFAMICLAAKPEGLPNEKVEALLREEISAKKLHQSVLVRDYEEQTSATKVEGEPYVVSVWGPERANIVAAFSKIFAVERINIESLRALPVEAGLTRLVFEVTIPLAVDRRALHAVLRDRARSMGLRTNMQHRDIFEAIHRVAVE